MVKSFNPSGLIFFTLINLLYPSYFKHFKSFSNSLSVINSFFKTNPSVWHQITSSNLESRNEDNLFLAKLVRKQPILAHDVTNGFLD